MSYAVSKTSNLTGCSLTGCTSTTPQTAPFTLTVTNTGIGAVSYLCMLSTTLYCVAFHGYTIPDYGYAKGQPFAWVGRFSFTVSGHPQTVLSSKNVCYHATRSRAYAVTTNVQDTTTCVSVWEWNTSNDNTTLIAGGVGTNWPPITPAGYTNGNGTVAAFSATAVLTAANLTANLYLADRGNYAIRRIYMGNVGGGPATTTTYTHSGSNLDRQILDGTLAAARYYNPYAIACDSSDNIYVLDRAANGDTWLRKLDASNVTSLVNLGAGEFRMAGSGANVFITDASAGCVRKWDGATLSVFATGLVNPGAICNNAGALYVADNGSDVYQSTRISAITAGGVVSTSQASTVSGTLSYKWTWGAASTSAYSSWQADAPLSLIGGGTLGTLSFTTDHTAPTAVANTYQDTVNISEISVTGVTAAQHVPGSRQIDVSWTAAPAGATVNVVALTAGQAEASTTSQSTGTSATVQVNSNVGSQTLTIQVTNAATGDSGTTTLSYHKLASLALSKESLICGTRSDAYDTFTVNAVMDDASTVDVTGGVTFTKTEVSTPTTTTPNITVSEGVAQIASASIWEGDSSWTVRANYLGISSSEVPVTLKGLAFAVSPLSENLHPGDTAQLTFNLTDYSVGGVAHVTDVTQNGLTHYTSSDPSIASVTNNGGGLITAHAVGEATISAYYHVGTELHVPVTIGPADILISGVMAYQVSPGSRQVNLSWDTDTPGSEVTVVLQDSLGQSASTLETSTGTSVSLQVGALVASQTLTAVVTPSTGSPATRSMTYKKLAGVTLSKSSLLCGTDVDSYDEFSVTAVMDDASMAGITDLASLSATGTSTPEVTPGLTLVSDNTVVRVTNGNIWVGDSTGTVKASYLGLDSGDIPVTMKGLGLAISPTQEDLHPGDTAQLTATLTEYAAGGTARESDITQEALMHYTSADTGIASVTNNGGGLVTAVAVGSTSISAFYHEGIPVTVPVEVTAVIPIPVNLRTYPLGSATRTGGMIPETRTYPLLPVV